MKLSHYLTVAALMIAVVGTSVVNVASASSMYRWIDEHGEIIYSDRRPSPEAERLDEGPAWGEAAEEAEAGEAPDAEAEAEREARCAEAQRMLAEYEQSEFLFRETEDGDEEILTSEEREAEIERMQGIVERTCN